MRLKTRLTKRMVAVRMERSRGRDVERLMRDPADYQMKTRAGNLISSQSEFVRAHFRLASGQCARTRSVDGALLEAVK